MPHEPKMTPFYQSVLDAFTTTQKHQIEKGAAKYPEPFNPASWTPEQLLDHGMQEAVDLMTYLLGLHFQLKQMEQEMRRLNDIIADKDRNISELVQSQTRINKMLTADVKRKSKPSPFELFQFNTKPPYMDLDD